MAETHTKLLAASETAGRSKKPPFLSRILKKSPCRNNPLRMQ
jgi:hypothetical protein